MDAAYEIFEHTADIGLRVRAPDLNALFAEAGRGLLALILEDPPALEATDQLTFTTAAGDLEDLFFDYLSELLYLFDARHLALRDARVALTPVSASIPTPSVHVTVTTTPFDPDRHRVNHEVKAVTYHHLMVQQQPDGSWLAEVILDI